MQLKFIVILSLLINPFSIKTMAQTTMTLQKMEGFPCTEQGYEKGVSACFCGVLNGWLYVSGGCNFPEKPVAEGGEKRYYQAIYAARLGQEPRLAWRKVGELPAPAAYGVSVVYENSLLFIGGNNAKGSLTTVIRLRGELKNGTNNEADAADVTIDSLPSLPHALDNMAGVAVGRKVFVLGGNCDGKASRRVWSLDMTCLENGWTEETEMPGIARVQPVAAQLENGGLAVWGGFAPKTETHAAELALGGLLLTEKGEWSPLAAPVDEQNEEVFLGGAAAIGLPSGDVLAVGGVNKEVFLAALNRLPEGYLTHAPEWYRFNRRALLYKNGSWHELLQDPCLARAGCALAYHNGWVYVVGGELKPGIRTPEIVRVRSK